MHRSIVWISVGVFIMTLDDLSQGQTITQGDCSCSCLYTNVTLTSKQLQRLGSSEAIKIREELTIDKQILSLTLRKKISIPDQRPSAQSIGYFGVVIMATVGIIIFVMDVPHFCQMTKDMCKTVFKKKLV